MRGMSFFSTPRLISISSLLVREVDSATELRESDGNIRDKNNHSRKNVAIFSSFFFLSQTDDLTKNFVDTNRIRMGQ